MDQPPPPPPPPHGQMPKSSNSNLPPGKYDIFIIPPHSSGSGFLYLPSLKPNINSFAAGFASALVLVVLCQSMAPAFRAWWSSFQGMGNMGMMLLVLAVGVGAWSLGRTQQEGGPGPGGGSGGGHGGYTHGTGGYSTGPNPNAGQPPNTEAPPPPPPHSSPPPPQTGPPPQSGPQPQPQSRPQAQPEPQSRPAPPPSTPDTENRKPSWQQRPQPESSQGSWAKAREETRRKEEERKAKEAEQRRKEELAKRLKELREKEARERAKRQQEAKDKQERETREKEEREKEARAKEQQEKAQREKEQRESRMRETRERELRERLEREKKLREKLEQDAREREASRLKEAEAAKQKAAEAATRKSTYAFSSVGEKTNPWPNGKPPEQPPASAKPNTPHTLPKRPPPPTARTFNGMDDEAYSYRPYDQPKAHHRRRSGETVFTESSYAASQSTSRTTPPPSVRGSYTTKDPDKIVIRAVYGFLNQFSKTPASQLISGVGTVTDGLILRITTEGLFIDDDVRGVPQREWDVKAWTLKLMEVWCPSHCFIDPNASPKVAQKTGTSRFRLSARGPSKALTGEDADTFLTDLLHSCKDECRLGARGGCDASSSYANNTTWQTGEWKHRGLHVLRATIRDEAGKRYMFVLNEEEGWKVAVGLQRLRKGTQVRQLGIEAMSAAESKNTFEMLGW